MIEEIRNALQGKTVFLTGHTGFKGSWMCLWLKSLGARVVGYSLDPPTEPSHFDVCDVGKLIDLNVIGDIRDFDHIRQVMRESEPDFVFHLAAQTVVKTGYERPRETFDINVTGTASVLDAVAALERRCTVVCVTSDKCYANDDLPRAFKETDAMGEREPYGASKGCTELVVKAYAHSYFHPQRFEQHGVAIATARAGNVVGGGDWTPYALLPDLVAAAEVGGVIGLRNPYATRPWQHVLQTLSGYLLLAARLAVDPQQYSGGWNFGPNESESSTVACFSERFFHSWGQGNWVDVSKPEQVHEAQCLALSIAKAREHLQWAPVWDTSATIDMCVDWFKQFGRGMQPRAIGFEQIRRFELDAAAFMS